MSIQSVNPFSNFKTNFSIANITTNNSQQTQNTNSTTDKNNKNTTIIGALGALTILGIGITIAIKKCKTPVMENANAKVTPILEDVQRQAKEALDNAQKLFEDVTELFKKGDETATDGTVLRKITDDGTEKIMQEFDKNGNLYRKSTFENGSLIKIVNNYQESDTSILADYTYFKDGKPSLLITGLGTINDMQVKAKQMNFENGKLVWYEEGLEYNTEIFKKAKEICFQDAEAIMYQESFESQGGIEKAAKTYHLINKSWQEITQ